MIILRDFFTKVKNRPTLWQNISQNIKLFPFSVSAHEKRGVFDLFKAFHNPIIITGLTVEKLSEKCVKMENFWTLDGW